MSQFHYYVEITYFINKRSHFGQPHSWPVNTCRPSEAVEVISRQNKVTLKFFFHNYKTPSKYEYFVHYFMYSSPPSNVTTFCPFVE